MKPDVGSWHRYKSDRVQVVRNFSLWCSSGVEVKSYETGRFHYVDERDLEPLTAMEIIAFASL